MGSIRIGYGSDQRRKNPKNCYGKKSSGKVKMNGGFSGEPTTDFHDIPEETWINMFGTAGMPKWKLELLKEGKL